MSFISIRRYLDMVVPGGSSVESQPDTLSGTCHSLCEGLLEAMEARSRNGSMGENASGEGDLAEEWAVLRCAWSEADRPAECPQFTARALELAARENEAAREASHRQAADMQSILTMLNDALLGFATGSERSIERLHRVQASLTRASRLDDIVSLKAMLAETIRLIREETQREQQESAEAVTRMQDKFVWVREAVLRHAPGLPGREAAMEAVDALQHCAQAADLAVLAAQLEHIPALSGRFSPAVSEEAILAFAHTAAADAYKGVVYRWAPDTILWITEIPTDIDRLRAALEDRLTQPHEYHGVANGRKVLFQLPIRWMCATLTEQPVTGLAEQIDRLGGGLVRA